MMQNFNDVPVHVLHCRKSGNSLYELLGVEKSATHDDIRKTYRRVSETGLVNQETFDSTRLNEFVYSKKIL